MQINSCLNHADKAGWHSLELQVAHQPEVKPVYSTLQGNLKRQLFPWLLNFFVWVFLLSMIGRYWMSSNHPLACFPISGRHTQQHWFRSGIRAWFPSQYFSIPPSATWIISFPVTSCPLELVKQKLFSSQSAGKQTSPGWPVGKGKPCYMQGLGLDHPQWEVFLLKEEALAGWTFTWQGHAVAQCSAWQPRWLFRANLQSKTGKLRRAHFTQCSTGSGRPWAVINLCSFTLSNISYQNRKSTQQ